VGTNNLQRYNIIINQKCGIKCLIYFILGLQVPNNVFIAIGNCPDIIFFLVLKIFFIYYALFQLVLHLKNAASQFFAGSIFTRSYKYCMNTFLYFYLSPLLNYILFLKHNLNFIF